MTYRLILLRHGESEWNKANRFGGWADLRLTQKGRQEAYDAGLKLAKYDHQPQKVYTSMLSRAIETANIVLEASDRLWLDIDHTYHINERHYGALQGRNKEEVEELYGHDQFMLFRRSLDVPPPPIDPHDKWSQVGDPRYHGLVEVPLTESLETMAERIHPWWTDVVSAELRDHKTVLVVGHGNSLRGLIRIVRKVSNEAVKKIDLKTGIPFVIELNEDLEVVDEDKWCVYIDK